MEKGSFCCADISEKLGFVAAGGTEGKLQLFDLSAKIKLGESQLHKEEIIQIKFVDQRNQLVTVSKEKLVAVWDSYNLECMQHLRDSAFTGGDFYSASTLSISTGELINANLTGKVLTLSVNMRLEMETMQTEAIIQLQEGKRMAKKASVKGNLGL